MDLSELLAKFKNLGTGENMAPETSLQTASQDANAPMVNPPVPATFGDETIPYAHGQTPEPQQFNMTPQPGDPGHTQSIFDQVSSKLQEKAAAGDVAAPSSGPIPAFSGGSDDSDYEPDTATPSAETPAPKAEVKSPEGYQLGTKENLEKAQRKSGILNLLGGLSDTGSEFLNNTKAIGDMFTHNPNGVKYGNDTGNTLRSMGEATIKNHQALIENQKNDPKSQGSVEMRDLVRQMGFPVSENVSAADLEKKFPGLSNIFSAREAAKSREAMAKENRESREAIARENRESRKEMAELMAKNRQADKQEKTTANLMQRMKDDLDPDKARGGNLAANQKQVYQAERLEQLYTEANGDIRNLDSRQMEELAIGLNKLLSGSSTGAASQIEALVPKTAAGNSKKLAEWLSNDPTGTGQVKFVQRMAETVEREKEIAKKQVMEAQKKRLPAYKKLKEADPESYQQILAGYGLSEDEGKPSSTSHKGLPDMSGPKTGAVLVLAPDGKVRMIPQDQVQNALAAGGKLAQ